MAYELYERVASALRSAVATDINTRIDAVNSAVTDGTTIEYPKEVLDHMPPLDAVFDFPLIGIIDGPGTWEDDTGFEAKGVYQMSLICVLQNAEIQLLVRQTRRYVKALVNSIMYATDNLPRRSLGPIYGMRVVRIVPGQIFNEVHDESSPPYAFVTWAELVIECLVEET